MSQYSTSWWLSVRRGPQAGSVYPLRGSTLTIGRYPDNYIVVDDPLISRYHARLTAQGSTFVLEDLGSANGTWVNGIRLAGPAVLRPGDVIGLGQEVEFVFSNQPQYANDVASLGMGATQQALMQPPSGAAPVVRRPIAPRLTQNWILFAVGGLIAIVALSAIVLAASLLRQDSPARLVDSMPSATLTPTATHTPVPTATHTPVPTATPYPTYTPAPTYTPIPTLIPTATPYPTYTPIPTLPPTYTPYPTYTPIPTLPPTYTPYPTYTPFPTPKPTRKPSPTDTPVPTIPPEPLYTLSFNKFIYEQWGRPMSADGCNKPFNDKDPVRRLTVEFVLTNHSNRYIPDGWHPEFYTAKGQVPPTCIWYYDNTAVQPGETIYVTFATHVELDDWVQAIVLDELGYTLTICFNSAGQIIACR